MTGNRCAVRQYTISAYPHYNAGRPEEEEGTCARERAVFRSPSYTSEAFAGSAQGLRDFLYSPCPRFVFAAFASRVRQSRVKRRARGPLLFGNSFDSLALALATPSVSFYSAPPTETDGRDERYGNLINTTALLDAPKTTRGSSFVVVLYSNQITAARADNNGRAADARFRR